MFQDEHIKVISTVFSLNLCDSMRFNLVSLSGFRSQSYQALFKEFMLIAVSSTWSDEQSYRPIGQFELLSSTNTNDESTQEAIISQRNCPGGVTDVNPDKLKNAIYVNWIAPRHAQGCVSFKYRFFLCNKIYFLINVEQRLYVRIQFGLKMIMLLRIQCVKIVCIL